MGILDTIIHTKQNESLTQFRAGDVVKELLAQLKERDRQILTHRYGLEGQPTKTLAAIGQQQNLTRERVRQIEKDLMKQIRKNGSKLLSFTKTKEFLLDIITEHGRIIAEENLLLYLNVKDQEEKNSIIFLLHLIEELEHFIHDNYKKSWVAVLFNQQLLHEAVEESKKILEGQKRPLATDEFLENFRKTEFYQKNQAELNDKIILNFLELAIEIEKNVFGGWGMAYWKEITPKDVGDKAYLVMKHHKKPEHYSEITEMINKHKFDNRTAYKETVHNELIKDPRFILIGRGIYALSEWGYKPGVVSDVITEVLKSSQNPLDRDKIIEEVLKKRAVKKNTILVGLSNKKLFKKVGKNLYALA
jgi:DNA-directed RNA polymerase delta subunit